MIDQDCCQFKEQCHISRIFYFFIFLLFYEFLIDSVWLKRKNCIIFTFFCTQETTDVRRNHCNSKGYIPPWFLHSPCFKYIVYQINSLRWLSHNFLRALLFRCFFIIRKYRISDHARPPLRTPSWIPNLKTLVQRFQVYYAQKHMRERWHCSFK